MKKALFLIGIILIGIFSLISTTDSSQSAAQNGRITDFSAYDMPDDDGGGIVLKWKPLSKEHRIIKYNIYRGVSPDSLYLITSLDVDPKTGVMAPELFYYDRGDQPLIEFESSPTRLRKEKHQAPNSPLYRKFPINVKLLSGVLDKYSILGSLAASNLYSKSKPIKKDTNVLTGIKLNHFESIYALPKQGTAYYYSVLGVTERGLHLPHSEVMEATPIDNPPDASAILQSTYVSDLNEIRFEWNPPVGSPDIAAWEGWLLPKVLLGEAKTLPENWKSAAIPIFQIPNSSSSPVYYHKLSLDDVPLPATIESFVPVLSYFDYAEQANAVAATNFRTITPDQLPVVPSFKVIDKANDKGDNLVISFGKPIAYIVQADYIDSSKKKLKINYEISANEIYTVDKIKFTFKTEDNRIIGKPIMEHFVDKVITMPIPPEFKGIKKVKAELAVMIHGSKTFESELVTQDVVYSDYFRRFQPKDTFIDGKDINKLYYDVFTKSRLDWDFFPGLRAGAISRTNDHSIPYEDKVFKLISGYDKTRNMLTLETRIMVASDTEKGLSFDVPLFKSAFEDELKQAAQDISDLEASLANNPANADSIKAELDSARQQYDFITNHPAYTEAKSKRSNKAWLKTMIKHRDMASRAYAYKLLATDGKGAFMLSEVLTDPKGNIWFSPTQQWFDSSKTVTLLASILLMILVLYAIFITRRKEVYIRPIAGLHEIDNAVGRATEMGRPVMFVPGWGSLGDVCTIASLMILSQVAKKTAEYDTRLISPHCDYMVMPLAQEIVQTAYSEMGRPDSFNQNDIFFVSYDQFPFCAGVNGITVRERVATIFYMGYFNAEALLLTETGNQTGAIQIAATDAVTQIPFFITTCDYTLIGEEFYAASAYLSRNHDLVSMLKAQDYFKLFVVAMVIIGTILSTVHMNGFINLFPIE